MRLLMFVTLLVLTAQVGCESKSAAESKPPIPSSTLTDASEAPIASTPLNAGSSPIDIVNERMATYNDHAIEPFLKLYSDEIEIFTYPDRSLGKGKAHIRKLFEPMFVEAKVHVEIHGQFAKDSYVVNHETVSYGDDMTDYISIYEVKDGLIQSVRFVRD